LEADHQVRAVARDPDKLTETPWYRQTEVVAGDLADPESVAAAVAGQDVVYYLVHSLQQKDFVERDRGLARTVADAARDAGVKRVVYLGGITPEGGVLSSHLASRKEVGEILLDSGVPTVVLRAAIIIGSGSASFEMLRYLTEPRGLAGHLYWKSIAPFHHIIFGGMARNITGAAEREELPT
ncbi:MAG: SDR family oxidoreductase, partial [Pseudonocardiaceae bacterium]|nr:SDR family oxidoreductase [Pseudonocardiaceae bacterium]